MQENVKALRSRHRYHGFVPDPSATLAPTARIHPDAIIGPGVRIGEFCVVESDVLVGMGSILLDNCHIESWCVIGAGALVRSGMRVPTGSLVLGAPGRIVRTLTEVDRQRIRHGCAEYLRLAATYRNQGLGR